MLQRAASNAHSWRTTTHFRSKQSKWLDQSLQDMEQKVQYVLKLIQEDGDSFAKRAEMYYKKRPELVNFVEESNRAYRALAERYEHLSTELQYANNTLATLFPEQFQMPMDDEDDSPSSKAFQNPNSPKFGKKSLSSASKQLQARIFAKTEISDNNDIGSKSSLSKREALEEIEKLQKDILALQTVKEFVKSSYQGGLSRYWGIENQILEMQQKVSVLQEEFSVNKVVDDTEARTLMAEAALRSCQETLTQLQEKKDKHDQDATKEFKKIEDAREKLNSIRLELLNDQAYEEDKNMETKDIENANSIENDNEKMDANSLESNTVTRLTEKIDELVNKVLSLENSVSTQAILIERLRKEADDLHSQIRALEADKANLINDTHNLRSMIEKLEAILNGIQKLNRDVEIQSNNFQTSLAQACSSLDHLSEKLSNVKPDEKQEQEQQEEEISYKVDEEEESAEASEKLVLCETKGKSETNDNEKTIIEILKSPIRTNVLHETDLQQPVVPTEAEKDGEFNWQQMLLTGLEDKESLLLTEYATILKKYKEAKKELMEMEKENRHYQFEVTLQIRELKCALLKRDEEIRRLLQTPNILKPEDIYTFKEDEDIKCIPIDEAQVIISPLEEKFRQEIDVILDENLEYMLRYSTSYHQIKKFEYAINDLRDQTEKLKLNGKQEGCVTGDLKSEIWVIHNHLREIQREQTVWLEHSLVLRDELDKKFSSLCNIQEKIMKTEAVEMGFSSNQRAKFQGEIMNMKQENNKIREQLQMGIDHVITLQVEISGSIRKLKEFEVTMDRLQTRYSFTQTRIPLQSFIFGTKKKKHRGSIFSRMLSKRSRT